MLHEWERSLAFDLAMYAEKVGEELPVLLKKYNITEDDIRIYLNQSDFKRLVTVARDKIKDSGIAFKYKAQVIVDSWMLKMDDLMSDPMATSTSKVDLFKFMTQAAGYAKKDEAIGTGNGTGVHININFAHKPEVPLEKPTLVIDHEAVN